MNDTCGGSPCRRRRAGAVVVALALLASACGGGDQASEATAGQDATTSGPASVEEPASSSPTPSRSASPGTAADGEDSTTRTVETSFGVIEVPVDPRRVVALDEYAAMNLLAVGIRPTQVFGAYSSLVSQEILGDGGVPVIEQAEAFDVNFEAIAAEDPDMIVVTAESAFVERVERLTEIAPTAILPYTAPWREVVADTGRLFDRGEQAERIVAALEDVISEVSEVVEASTVGSPPPPSLSILGETFGTVFAVSPESVLSAVVDDAGFERPDAQVQGAPLAGFEAIIPISTELLEEHDADVVAVMSGVYYAEEVILDVPTFASLSAVRAGRSVVVDGDMWFGTHPFAVYWLLQDLRGLAAGEGADGVGDLDDTDARWAEYQALFE